MKITHCKLKKSTQKKLLEFFVTEVTARSAADLIGIHPNFAALFYHKIRLVIEHHLSLQADDILMVKLNLMKAILVVIARENEGEVPLEKLLFLVF